jgi:8-oxo-dGTP diphosphatase
LLAQKKAACQILPLNLYNQITMSTDNIHSTWVNNPTGKIAKGEFCQACGKYNSRNLAVHALVIYESKILLVKRAHDPMKNSWAIPGGYIDWDETVEEAVLRELKEETQLEGKILCLTGVYSDINRDEDGRQNIALTYLVSSFGEAKANDDAKEIAWFEINKLPENIAFDNLQMINDGYKIYTDKFKA